MIDQINLPGDEAFDLALFRHHASGGVKADEVETLLCRLRLHGLADRNHVWKLKAEHRGAQNLFVIRRRGIGKPEGRERHRNGKGCDSQL
jgi:hypothetical protein